MRHLVKNPIELTRPITFLVGDNGAGKSTLVEAIAVAAGKGAQRKLIQTRHFGPPNMFCARATSRSARSRSDSARATARPNLVRW